MKGIAEKPNIRDKYEITIWWNRADKVYLAEAPELSGCIADGKTYESALRNVRVIIKEWLETARKEGRRIPRPKDRRSIYPWFDGTKMKYREPKVLLEVRAVKRKLSKEIEKLGWEGFHKKHEERTRALTASIEKARQEKLAGRR